MKPSAIAYIEIPAPNFEASKVFYKEVFQWNIVDSYLDDSPYAMFSVAGDAPGLKNGGLNPNLDVQKENSLSLFISVTDIPSILKKITDQNGKIVKSKTEIGGGYGFFASFQDINGNFLNIWSEH